MSHRRDGRLFLQNLAANAAMCAFGQSRSRTRCRNRSINDYAVTHGRHSLLRAQHFTANAAMRTFGQSRSRTGCRNRSINDSTVTHGRHSLLRAQHFTANPAMSSFGQSRSRTGCRNGIINGDTVSQGRDFFLRAQYFTANTAMSSFGQSGLCASRRYCFYNESFMAGWLYGTLLDWLCAAHFTNRCASHTRLSTCGGDRNDHFESMTVWGNLLLRNKLLTANTTVTALR